MDQLGSSASLWGSWPSRPVIRSLALRMERATAPFPVQPVRLSHFHIIVVGDDPTTLSIFHLWLCEHQKSSSSLKIHKAEKGDGGGGVMGRFGCSRRNVNIPESSPRFYNVTLFICLKFKIKEGRKRRSPHSTQRKSKHPVTRPPSSPFSVTSRLCGYAERPRG